MPAPHESDVHICEWGTEWGSDATRTLRNLPPLGGRIKHLPADFVVNELRGDDGAEVVLRADERDAEGDASVESGTMGDGGECVLRFTLHKIRKDTLEALADLSELTGIPQRAFAMCGIKDAFAVTTQEVTVRGASVAELRAVTVHNVILGGFTRVQRPLRVGAAGGNRFRIRVRGVRASEPQLRALCAAAHSGALRFVNYYGLQRFGTGGVHSHDLGRWLLRRDYEAIVHALVCAPSADPAVMSAGERAARDHFGCTLDAGQALQRLPRHLRQERALLARLHRADERGEGGSWRARCRAAVLSLPLARRRLWANAYYSYLYNLAASERIARLGLRVVEGDLVVAQPASAGAKPRRTDAPDAGPSLLGHVSVTTDADVRAGRYSIEHVVLPLLGTRAITPTHEIGALCRAYVAYDGIESHSLEARNSEEVEADVDSESPAEDAAETEVADAKAGGGQGPAAKRARQPSSEGVAHARAAQPSGAGAAAAEAGPAPQREKADVYELHGSYRHLTCTLRDLEVTPLAPDAPTPAPPNRVHFEMDGPANAPLSDARRRAMAGARTRGVRTASDAPGVGLEAAPAAAEPRLDALFTFSLPAGSYATVALRELLAGGERAHGGAASGAAGRCAGRRIVGNNKRHLRFASSDDSDSGSADES